MWYPICSLVNGCHRNCVLARSSLPNFLPKCEDAWSYPGHGHAEVRLMMTHDDLWAHWLEIIAMRCNSIEFNHVWYVSCVKKLKWIQVLFAARAVCSECWGWSSCASMAASTQRTLEQSKGYDEETMKRRGRWNEDEMKMKWRWNENEMKMTWRWHEDDMKMKWRWNEDEMKMKRRWNKDEVTI